MLLQMHEKGRFGSDCYRSSSLPEKPYPDCGRKENTSHPALPPADSLPHRSAAAWLLSLRYSCHKQGPSVSFKFIPVNQSLGQFPDQFLCFHLISLQLKFFLFLLFIIIPYESKSAKSFVLLGECLMVNTSPFYISVRTHRRLHCHHTTALQTHSPYPIRLHNIRSQNLLQPADNNHHIYSTLQIHHPDSS